MKTAKQNKFQRATLILAACASMSMTAFAQTELKFDNAQVIKHSVSAAREGNEGNAYGHNKKCTLDMSTGVANWTIGGASAPIITPYQYWSQGVANSTITTSAVKWINNINSNVSPAGTYTYELKFKVPKQCAHKELIVEGIFSADNDASVKLVDAMSVSHTLAQTKLTPNYGFMVGHEGEFNQALSLPAGPSKMVATVTNIGSYSGFTMRAKLHP